MRLLAVILVVGTVWAAILLGVLADALNAAISATVLGF